MKIKKTVLLTIPFLLFAYNSKDFPYYEVKNKNFPSNNDYVTYFKINIKPDDVYQGRNAVKKYRSLMNQTFNPKILFKPLIKPLRNIDTLYIHPRFIATVVFPESVKIISVFASEKMNFLQFSNNLLMIKPKGDDGVGNLVVTAYDFKSKKNKIFNFILKPFFPENTRLNLTYGYYTAPSGAFLSLMVKYVENPGFNKIEILNKIISLLTPKKFNQIFAKNGSFYAVLVNHIPVYIQRDDKQGNIYAYKKKFIIKIGSLR